MNQIFTIGETIYDIIFEQGQPKAASVGGAMLNSAVSLGRCGFKVQMITEIGQDRVGDMAMEFLHRNGVSTSFIAQVKGLKTPVSLAFLDGWGNANYSFYKNYPPGRLDIQWPPAGDGDMALFGSFYSLDPEIHGNITGFLHRAKSLGTLVIYDPNIRKNHLAEIARLRHFVDENISIADITRGSDEDFENLFGTSDWEQVFREISRLGCHTLIITRGKEGAFLYTERLRLHVPAEDVRVASTIGAGDGFNAGIISSLAEKKIKANGLPALTKDDWLAIIGSGVAFAGEVCGSYENYISKKDDR